MGAGNFPEVAQYNQGLFRVQENFDTGAKFYAKLPKDYRGSRKPKDTYRITRRDESGPDALDSRQGFIRKRLTEEGIEFERSDTHPRPKLRRRKF